jgi:hypothetical protein
MVIGVAEFSSLDNPTHGDGKEVCLLLITVII